MQLKAWIPSCRDQKLRGLGPSALQSLRLPFRARQHAQHVEVLEIIARPMGWSACSRSLEKMCHVILVVEQMFHMLGEGSILTSF